MYQLRCSYCISIFVLILFSCTAVANQEALQSTIEQHTSQDKSLKGFSFHVLNSQGAFNLVKGHADRHGAEMTPDHLFRIASVTKTFVAATTLRLVESGKLDLNSAIDGLIDARFNDLLKRDGYATDAITLKHLLTHTSGLNDHAQSAQFFEQISEDPKRTWTREEKVQGCIDWKDPIGAPGKQFSYSDTGYILLGHIIEKTSQLSLPHAVRQYLKFEQLKIQDVVWEKGDAVSVDHKRRVHQYFDGKDTFSWDPSMDLYGGGGLVASPKGMANFYQALFEHKIFNDKQTLEIMLSSEGLPSDSPSRMGIFVKDYNGLTVYEHSGFWGTLVMYAPDIDTYIAGGLVIQSDYKSMVKVMSDYLQKGKSGKKWLKCRWKLKPVINVTLPPHHQGNFSPIQINNTSATQFFS